MSEKVRSRNWNMVLYPDDPTHLDCMTKLSRGYQFVAIKHDKDTWEDGESDIHEAGTPKKEHWHVILKFPQARWQHAIASDLGIAERHIEQCRSFEGSALYLLHSGFPEKYQYDPDELFGPLTPAVLKLLETDVDQNVRVRNLLELIKAQKKPIDEWDLIELATDNGMIGDLLRMGSLIPRLVEIHNRRFFKEETERIAKAYSPFC